MGLPDSFNASGSFSEEGEGAWSDDEGEGEWGFSASASFSISFNHSFRPNTPEKPSPSPPSVVPVSPSPSPVSPTPSPEPILVNPCECCDCGDGAYKVPVILQGKTEPEVEIPKCNSQFEVGVIDYHPNGEIKREKKEDGTVYTYLDNGDFL